jgi:hypothetical protein
MTEFDRKEFGELFGSPSKVLPTGRTEAPAVGLTKTGTSAKEPQALLVSYGLARSPSKPPEIKQFFEDFRLPRPEAIQVILVLRGTEG